jgi:hypothetical protein
VRDSAGIDDEFDLEWHAFPTAQLLRDVLLDWLILGLLRQAPTDTPPADDESCDAAVDAWRLEQLLRAGYQLEHAEQLARRDDIDLHQAVELVDAGCAPALAASILL